MGNKQSDHQALIIEMDGKLCDEVFIFLLIMDLTIVMLIMTSCIFMVSEKKCMHNLGWYSWL